MQILNHLHCVKTTQENLENCRSLLEKKDSKESCDSDWECRALEWRDFYAERAAMWSASRLSAVTSGFHGTENTSQGLWL